MLLADNGARLSLWQVNSFVENLFYHFFIHEIVCFVHAEAYSVIIIRKNKEAVLEFQNTKLKFLAQPLYSVVSLLNYFVFGSKFGV